MLKGPFLIFREAKLRKKMGFRDKASGDSWVSPKILDVTTQRRLAFKYTRTPTK